MVFVNGRQITDVIILPMKLLITAKMTKGFVFKLNIEKAFDKVNWKFIMLMKKNFPKKWRDWISFCISTIQYSCLLMVNPRGESGQIEALY